MGELIATENGVEFWYGGCYVTSQPEQRINDAQFLLEAERYVYEPQAVTVQIVDDPRAGEMEQVA